VGTRIGKATSTSRWFFLLVSQTPPDHLKQRVSVLTWSDHRGPAGATRPVSPSSPDRCDFTHPLGDLIEVSQERVNVGFVLTKQLELKAICDLDHAIKVTSHLLVESEVGAALCVAHDQDCCGGDAVDSFDVINSDTEMIEGLGPRREYRVLPCFPPSCNRYHEASDGHQ
jgi:hypothetical protein